MTDWLVLTALKDLTDLDWTVQASCGMLQLQFLSQSAQLFVGAVVAVAPVSNDHITLECWCSKELLFPETKQTGRLNGRFTCFRGLKAVNASTASQQTIVIDQLPKTRAQCVPVGVLLPSSAFMHHRIGPSAILKRLSQAGISKADLSVATALAYVQGQQGKMQFPRYVHHVYGHAVCLLASPEEILTVCVFQAAVDKAV